jgi:4-hydroxy-tetrahydrodipicolinate synthase
MEYTKSEAKSWAKEKMKGIEVPIFPSFTPDLRELDEEGIRFDVNQIYANGFTSIMAAPEACGMTFEERKQFVKIVSAEAQGKMCVSATVLQDTVEEDIEMLHHMEKVGCSHVALGHPVQYYPRSPEDIYGQYKYMANNTNLAISFYPGRMHTLHFHPSFFPPDVMVKIAELPNVVAMKITGGASSNILTIQAFELCGDKILVSDPMPDRWFYTIPKYGQQWAGAGPFYGMQTPEKPFMVRMFNLLVKGQIKEAMDVWWEMSRPSGSGGGLSDSYFHQGIVTAMNDKYAHWCCGGNGGTIRQPTGRLYDYQKDAIRAGLKAIGITPREPEEEFYVGRVNYAKGYRLQKFSA